MFGISSDALTLGTFTVRWYGIMIAVGMLLGVCVMSAREKRLGIKKDTSISLALWVIPIAVVCARLYYVAFEFDAYRSEPLSILNLREGGLAIYGGIIGGVLVGAVYARKTRTRFLLLADLVAPALALSQAVGRWGNFFNQEAYGPAVNNPRLAFFPLAVYIDAEGGWFMATFFYESLWCACLCAAILALEKRGRLTHPGDAFLFYAFGYAAERTVVEALRVDSLYIYNVRVSQALSALVLCALTILLARNALSKKRALAYVAVSCALSAPVLLAAFGVIALPIYALALACALMCALCVACFYAPSRAARSSFRLRK